MEEDEFLLHASSFVLLALKREIDKRKRRRKHRFRVRDIFKKRREYGVFNTLMQELRLSDREYFFR